MSVRKSAACYGELDAGEKVKTKMSADEARRIALAAQGFAEPRPSARLDRRHLRRVIAQSTEKNKEKERESEKSE